MPRSPDHVALIPRIAPHCVMTLILAMIYVGFLVFPTIKQAINHEDCIASGRADCGARPLLYASN
ncbi:MAG: hypothetical protein ACRYGI_20820 [Janthinobacterium lividum]